MPTDSDLAFIPLGDSRYPRLLREIPDPPAWLFVDGEASVLHRECVSIVGTRRASQQGLRAAERIAMVLAEAGYTICSGLALGIDGAAHRGALQGGTTSAVLASGLDRPSPRQHQSLAKAIRRQGCLLSELPPGTTPAKHRFPRRNRIISGLSRATIIVEAALPSGSLHSAAAALEQGREVFVLPWSVFHTQGRGCLHLLRDGAVPLINLDSLADYFPAVKADSAATSTTALDEEAIRVVQTLGDGQASAATLALDLGVPLTSLLPLLGELEVAGVIAREHGLYQRI